MAKLKTKTTVMDTKVTEVSPGRWEWIIDEFIWAWEVGRIGFNLFVAETGEDRLGTFQPALHCRTLEHAVMFSHGFDGGVTYTKIRHGIKDSDTLTTPT